MGVAAERAGRLASDHDSTVAIHGDSESSILDARPELFSVKVDSESVSQLGSCSSSRRNTARSGASLPEWPSVTVTGCEKLRPCGRSATGGPIAENPLGSVASTLGSSWRIVISVGSPTAPAGTLT